MGLAEVQLTLYLYHNVYWFSIGPTDESRPLDTNGANHFQMTARTSIGEYHLSMMRKTYRGRREQISNSPLGRLYAGMMDLLPHTICIKLYFHLPAQVST